nr:hypothetical protein [Tanacetum cinerariifolium]
MSSFNQQECLWCGQLCDGLYFMCQQCGVVLTNVICLNCTYGDGKPITCWECEGPLRELSIQHKEYLENSSNAITTILPTEEPEYSLSMGESEGIPENMCDVPFHDNSPPLDVSKDQFEDFSNYDDEFSSTDDDSSSIDNIDHVEASPPDSEIVSSEVMKIVIPEVEGIDDDILLTIKDNILREKLLNVNLLFAKIEALNDNPTPF